MNNRLSWQELKSIGKIWRLVKGDYLVHKWLVAGYLVYPVMISFLFQYRLHKAPQIILVAVYFIWIINLLIISLSWPLLLLKKENSDRVLKTLKTLPLNHWHLFAAKMLSIYLLQFIFFVIPVMFLYFKYWAILPFKMNQPEMHPFLWFLGLVLAPYCAFLVFSTGTMLFCLVNQTLYEKAFSGILLVVIAISYLGQSPPDTMINLVANRWIKHSLVIILGSVILLMVMNFIGFTLYDRRAIYRKL